MPSTVCFISFHELALKGRNRSVFERRLKDNLNACLRDTSFDVSRVKRIAGSLTVAIHDSSQAEECAHILARVPGVTAVAIAYKTNRDWNTICETALQALREAAPEQGSYTFKVDSRRSSTDFPKSSMDINREVGAHLLAAVIDDGAGVRMKNPDVLVSIKIVEGSTYISTRKIKGIGGLPSGSSGRTVSLLSSGIDSPVASYRMIKRGSVVLGLHFSGRPQTNDSSERLVLEIGEVLARTGGLARIYVIPFGDIQREVAATVEPSLRVIMYRRLMLVIAEKLACSQGAKALITGESLGQVASQTLDNIVATNEAVEMPVLRPLIGSDKDEIINEARHIGSFDLSIQDAEDCCTLFMPRSPETHARPKQVAASWNLLDVDDLVLRALESIEVHEFNPRFGVHKPLRVIEDGSV
ncbi:MAG: tRNA 4-thiouridine(8) synthase ThiI [Coriobacteriia bacterium]|nr:tRNA 4-thiouridine(8) synthase ThiI [Coriobacteriia bacterium]MCL2745729.1 tRNA 4-thiouridine(8) synthase ThiI [Coriobacteriia bacterium]MCL2871085.1 tRNA 4-thiouridine(8) synthase ThiI [Coriobacteriia bacterium]